MIGRVGPRNADRSGMVGEDLPDRPADLDLAEIENAAVGLGAVVHRIPPLESRSLGDPGGEQGREIGLGRDEVVGVGDVDPAVYRGEGRRWGRSGGR